MADELGDELEGGRRSGSAPTQEEKTLKIAKNNLPQVGSGTFCM